MLSDEALVVLGAGGHAVEIRDLLRPCGWHVAAFVVEPGYEPVPGKELGAPIVATTELSRFVGRSFVSAVGLSSVRSRLADLAEEAGLRPTSLIAPSAYVAASASLEPGVVLFPGAVVGARSQLGRHAHLNYNVNVSHDCQLAPFVTLAPGVTLGGGVKLGARVELGLNAAVLPGLRVGSRAVVGAGAVVTRAVNAGDVVAGVPARTIRR